MAYKPFAFSVEYTTQMCMRIQRWLISNWEFKQMDIYNKYIAVIWI